MAYLRLPLWLRWTLLVPVIAVIYVLSAFLAGIYQHFGMGEFNDPNGRILFVFPSQPFFIYTTEMLQTWVPAYAAVKYAGESIPEHIVLSTGLSACLSILVHIGLLVAMLVFFPHRSGTIWACILFGVASIIAGVVFVQTYMEDKERVFQDGRKSALSDYPRGDINEDE